MAIFNTTSVKSVLAKLYRDLALEDPNYELDFVEWCGEALEFIGSFGQMDQRVAEVHIENHKGYLPLGLVNIQQVKHNDCIISYNPSSYFGHCEDSPNLKAQTSEHYTLNPDFIYTSFEEGTLKVSYLSIPIDEEGFPLIPDNQYFKEALFWYCYRQLLLRGYQSKVPEINYFFADEKWRFYCSGARNKMNYPSLDQYERFRETWVGLIPNMNFHKDGYDSSVSYQSELDTVDARNLKIGPENKIKHIIIDGGTSSTDF